MIQRGDTSDALFLSIFDGGIINRSIGGTPTINFKTGAVLNAILDATTPVIRPTSEGVVGKIFVSSWAELGEIGLAANTLAALEASETHEGTFTLIKAATWDGDFDLDHEWSYVVDSYTLTYLGEGVIDVALTPDPEPDPTPEPKGLDALLGELTSGGYDKASGDAKDLAPSEAQIVMGISQSINNMLLHATES